MKIDAPVSMSFELRAWAKPKGDQTLDELIQLQEQLGNSVIWVDRDNNRLELELKD